MTFDEVVAIIVRSLMISGSATALASVWSIPTAMKLVMSDSRASRVLIDVSNALTSMPTVILGLILYLVLSRSGPLGSLGILYTPIAITIGQSLLITPYIISLTVSLLFEKRREVWETALSLGATRWQAAATAVKEGAAQLITVMLIAFNRAIGELGVALMLGGNIKGFTRVMTTAIALEVSRGDFSLALTMGGALLTLTMLIAITTRLVSKIL